MIDAVVKKNNRMRDFRNFPLLFWCRNDGKVASALHNKYENCTF